MSMTSAEAVLALGDPQYQSVEGLRILVSQVSVKVPGATSNAITLLYSGSLGNGPAWQVAEQIGASSGGRILTIGQTPVSKFLNSDAFKASLRNFAGDLAFDEAYNGAINADGSRTTGMWDVASRSFAEAAVGDVKTLTPFADPGKVFAQTELLAQLENPKINSIDGIPRSELLGFRDELLRLGQTEANRFVSDIVSIASRANLPEIGVAVQDGRIVWADVSRWTGVPPELAPLGSTVTDLGAIVGPPSMGDRLALTNVLEIPGVNYARYLEAFSKTGNWLGSIGGVLAYGSLLKVAYDASDAVQAGDPITAQELIRDWCLGSVGAAVLASMAFAGTSVLLAPLAVLGAAGIGAAVVLSIGTSILAAYWGHRAGTGLGEAISDEVNSFFFGARNVVIGRDPLVLDLDGDGLELTAASRYTLFDHNADGIRTGSGWVRPDDGLLVRDLNGNGVIDTGRELFGEDTVKSNGALAIQGFDALKDLDSNGDGFITSADAAFGELKVWQDANQDGISQSSELKTLGQLDITSIGLSGATTGPQAGQVINNNSVTLSTTYTRNGVARTVGSIELEANNFFSEFPDEVIDEAGNPVPITAQARALPQMNGAGMVRNMRAAASLSPNFADALQAYAATTTRDGQRNQLDSLITQWAATGTYPGGLLSGSLANITFALPPGVTAAEYCNMINVLEAFNGSRFYGNAQGGPRPLGFAFTVNMQAETGNTTHQYLVSPPAEQVALLRQAYNALKESVYGALVVQTRLKPYLDSIALGIDETGFHFDASPAVAMVLNKLGSDAYHAVQDLIDLQKYASGITRAMGWQPYQTLANILETTTLPTDAQNLLIAERIVSLGATGVSYGVVNPSGSTVLGNAGDNVITGAAGSDALYGLDGNDTLQAFGNNDTLDGGAGNDVLRAANEFYAIASTGTTFIGGTGNDTITGTYYNNTYVFNLGDGQDTVTNYTNTTSGFADVLKFGAGIAAADVAPVRVGEDLVFRLANGTDQVTVKNWFTNNQKMYQIEQVMFADGTVWTNSQINTRALEVFGTDGNDTMAGIAAFADVLRGWDGNDTLLASGNNDTLDGGAGNDVLKAVNEFYAIASTGTTFIGGTGNDTIAGTYYNNTYVFNLGDGQDTVTNYTNTTSGFADVLKFGVGIAAADVAPVRVGEDLVFRLANGTDQITVKNWFTNNQKMYQIEQVKFADGTMWTNSQINTRALEVFGTSGNDTLTGVSAFADVLRGGDGNDTLLAAGNNDTLDGGAGNDVLRSANEFYAIASTGTTFIGGTGNDTITGTYYNNTYVFNLGDGQDTVTNYTNTTSGFADVLKFGVGIAAADVAPVRVGEDLVFKLANGTDQVTVKSWFSNSQNQYQIEQVKFADGTMWTNTQVNSAMSVLTGTATADSLNGLANRYNMMSGLAGNDVMTGANYADRLDGGAGNDTLAGQSGNDTYILGRGYGADTLQEDDATAGNTDVLQFMSGIASDQLWLRQVGYDLTVSIIGTDDSATLSNWYLGAQHHVEQFRTSDGKILLDSMVQNLVDAMVGLAPPAAGQTTLSAGYQAALQPVFLANWQ
jgi:Ca2+-binding RTX toxin-like protein